MPKSGVSFKGKIQGQGDRSTIASCHCVSGLTRAYSSEVRLFDRERHNCRDAADAAAPLPPIPRRLERYWRSQVRYISDNLKLLEIHITWDPQLLRDRRILPFFSSTILHRVCRDARVASRESFCTENRGSAEPSSEISRRSASFAWRDLWLESHPDIRVSFGFIIRYSKLHATRCCEVS